MTHDIHTETLPCGLRLIVTRTTSEVAYCGLAVNAGTRDERPEESGLAHFCEHLTFKGTHRRRAWHVLNRMETVGGDLNAYTGKEETIYYTAFLREHLARAIDLVTDIVLGSTYPQAEMEKEVEVVIDEIESYRDSPAELIYDDFEDLIFHGHPLGRNILGREDCLRTFRSADVSAFTARCYHPRNMVLFVQGNVEPRTVRRLTEQSLRRVADSLSVGSPLLPLLHATDEPTPTTDAEMGRTVLPPYEPREVVMKKGTHQAHVMMGTRCYGARDPRHLRLYLLNNILGGPGMNSRLNLSLRERHGLVYSVESNQTCYTDTGVWSIYFGCDAHDLLRCRRLVMAELKRLTDAPLPATTLAAAKRQIKGQLGIANENGESTALAGGKTYLHYHKLRSTEELFRRIDALTAEELHETAQEIFNPARLTTLIYR